MIAIPPGSAGPARPTGIVFNGSTDFKVTQNGVTGASSFIFVGEAGTVSGWSPAVNRTNSVTLVDTAGALNAPWGMALAPAGFGDFSNSLLVANFGDGKIDAYN